jgi:cyanophycinase
MLSASARAQQIGPANGTLVIVGGAMRDTTIVNRFLEAAGGSDARIVVIPTAAGADAYDSTSGGANTFQERGAATVTVIHTNDRDVADSEEFVNPIREATGVWFSGGRQWRLVDAYADTRTEEECWRLLERGGAIGGSSAGATIQGSYLARGDTRTNTIMMGDHEEGFGFLQNSAIDQHLLRRNRHFDLIEIVEAHPELLGLGIDENTAIVVQGDTFDVIGQGYVAIYDHGRTIDGVGRFYFLAPGDRFDLATREATRRIRGEWRPVEGTESSPWRPR